ncbi:MAG: uracil-DNA glycosylase [Planctomycetota bacterium]|mgnify:CR=1 FL=1|nr:MAG: uracil-DNA glycosylase [Planctomycetota bacterium]
MSNQGRKGGGRAVRAAIQTLDSLQQAGVKQLPRRRSPAKQSPDPASQVQPEPPPAATAASSAPPHAQPGALPLGSLEATPGDTLEVIQSEVAGCTLCDELASTRTQTVFGVGNPNARLCFLGEAPGADEDKQGEPFVGRAGQLLTKIIEACTLSRSEVYILNVLKCRPPGNRNPAPQEAANCREYLDRQLAVIRPEFICCLGSVAAQNLLDTDQSIGRMRGKFFDYQGIAVMCTYHPAYLLRNPAAKKDVWEDMKMLLRKMGIKLKQ